MHTARLATASLLLLTLAACTPKVPAVPSAGSEATGPGPGAADEEPALDSVFFAYGKATLSAQTDEDRVAAAARALAGDKRRVLVVIGYADPSGTEGANLALSQARAEVIREMVIKDGNLDTKRVIARGLGELDRSGRANTSLRRVDFIPLRLGPLDSRNPDKIVGALVEAGRIDPGAQAVLGASAQGGSQPTKTAGAAAASTASGERENIEPTGLSDVDAVFAQVQGLLDTVRGAQDDISAANQRLRSALGADGGASMDDALADLKAEAKGSIRVEMAGGKPRLTTAPGASPKVTQAVGALNGLVKALGGATQKLAQVPKQAQAVIVQAKALPGTLPNTLKQAGLGAKELPKMLRIVKKNIKLTASVPKACAQVGKETAGTFKSIAGAFR